LLGTDGLDLGSWGRLEIIDRRHLGVRTSSGLRDIEVDGLLEGGGALVGWFDPHTGIAILASTSSELVRIDLYDDQALVMARLDRESDEDLRFTSFHEADSCVICLYERGVLCMEHDGTIRWKVAHSNISAQFMGVQDRAVWFAAQWPPDRSGDRWGYNLSDGAEVFN
jgi:hypothetical protein